MNFDFTLDHWTDTARDAETVHYCVECLANIDRKIMREARERGRPLPPLYRSGLRYQEQHGHETWGDALWALKNGGGDCKVLSAYRIAELLLEGKPAHPVILVQPNILGGITHHVCVGVGGIVEDPSSILGMKR